MIIEEEQNTTKIVSTISLLKDYSCSCSCPCKVEIISQSTDPYILKGSDMKPRIFLARPLDR